MGRRRQRRLQGDDCVIIAGGGCLGAFVGPPWRLAQVIYYLRDGAGLRLASLRVLCHAMYGPKPLQITQVATKMRNVQGCFARHQCSVNTLTRDINIMDWNNIAIIIFIIISIVKSTGTSIMSLILSSDESFEAI